MPVYYYYSFNHAHVHQCFLSKNFWTESKWPKMIWLVHKGTIAMTVKSTLQICCGRFMLLFILWWTIWNRLFHLQQLNFSVLNWQSTASKSCHRGLEEILTLIFDDFINRPNTVGELTLDGTAPWDVVRWHSACLKRLQFYSYILPTAMSVYIYIFSCGEMISICMVLTISTANMYQ